MPSAMIGSVRGEASRIIQVWGPGNSIGVGNEWHSYCKMRNSGDESSRPI